LVHSIHHKESSVVSEHASQVRKSAEDSFASGLYCAESVLLALAKGQDIENEFLPKMATGFCGGMARTCGTCGAVTGAIMGIGLALGRSQAGQSVQPAYAATQRLIGEFEQEFGSRDCHVLLGCDLGTPKGQATFREKKLGERCARYTGRAAEIAANILNEAQEA
jgi:C_GCAxxG_C_C family probable redox protein